MRATILAALLAGLGLTGCSPELRDGAYSCTTDDTCPDGWFCVDGRCFRERGMGGECRIDAHCPDVPCQTDFCESGFCLHEPATGPCDDTDYCNGADECRDGACVNVGPPPCPDCVDGRCADCGRIGFPCCEGDDCEPGSRCEGMECTACGTVGAPCCELGCSAPDLICSGGSCARCGSEGAPCCPTLPVCTGSLECNGMICAPPEGCTDIDCNMGETCVDGTCLPCGALGAPCCHSSDGLTYCDPALMCSFVTDRCEATATFCGGPGEPCCAASPECTDGLVCRFDDAGMPGTGMPTCQPCGITGGPCCPSASMPCSDPLDACDGMLTCSRCGGREQPCCSGSMCTTSDLICDSFNRCIHCGDPTQPCCRGTFCNTVTPGGNVCIGSTCRLACGERGEMCCTGPAAYQCLGGACAAGMCP